MKRSGRSKAEFNRIYGGDERMDWLLAQPCVVSGRRGNIECVHVKGDGMARKAGYQWTVPMNASLHRVLHTMGIRSFEKRYNIDLELAAIATQQAWLAHCARMGPEHISSIVKRVMEGL